MKTLNFNIFRKQNLCLKSHLQTWIKDDNRLETRKFHLINVESLNLQTQLGHDSIKYLHDARLNSHVAAECVARSEAHLLRLHCASLEATVGIPSIVFDVL